MDCQYCNKQFDLKNAWQKESFTIRLGDALRWLGYGSSMRQLKENPGIIGTIGVFVIGFVGMIFLPEQRIGFIIFPPTIQGLFIIFLWSFLIYRVFIKNLDKNLVNTYNRGSTIITCPYCYKSNKI